MLVSVIIGLLNEEKYLPKLIEDFKRQTYPHKNIELIFIDGMSTDKSWEILNDFENKVNDFYDIKLLKNPKRILSAGMNIGIQNSTGNLLLKVDCHSHLTDDFIKNNIKIINEGEYVCGGPRPNIIENSNNFKNTLLLVEENLFGSGIASYRKKSDKKYVNSVFQGMYRKEVFEKCGLLNESVGRVEDNELHYRIRNNGYKIRYSNDILSYQYTRPTLRGMVKQKYSNGYWIGKVSHIYSKAFSIFHFVPVVFVSSIIFSLLLLFVTNFFILTLAIVYFLFTVLVTILTMLNNKFNLTLLLMPILLFLIHFSYGLGTLIGLLKGFSWKKEYYKN